MQVSAGTFGGVGNIDGAVTVGTGFGAGAFLEPSSVKANKSGGLIVHGSLTFQSDGTYNCDMFAAQTAADQIVAAGVTIQSGAEFTFIPHGPTVIPVGTVSTIIRNTAATPIAGAFNNLADGAVLTASPNKFQADYQGGDGNDLTLTVVP